MLVNTKLPPSGIATLAKKILKSADKCEQVVYNRKKALPQLSGGILKSIPNFERGASNTLDV